MTQPRSASGAGIALMLAGVFLFSCASRPSRRRHGEHWLPHRRRSLTLAA